MQANQSGVNTHAILKAPKTDGAEAVVLAASWLSRDGQRLNTRGVALVLGLAKYLSSPCCHIALTQALANLDDLARCVRTEYAVWSKDIIFLISDGYSEGAQAWITSYHSLQHQGMNAQYAWVLRSGYSRSSDHFSTPQVCRQSHCSSRRVPFGLPST